MDMIADRLPALGLASGTCLSVALCVRKGHKKIVKTVSFSVVKPLRACYCGLTQSVQSVQRKEELNGGR